MTEVQLLFLVLAFIYACECVCWLPAGAVAFRTWLGRRWRPVHPGTLLGNQQGGLLLAHPLPPLGTLLLGNQLPLSLSPDAVLAFVASAINPAGRPAQTAKLFRFDEIRGIDARGRKVLVNGELLLRASSPTYAAHLVEQMRQLREALPAARAAAIRALQRQSLDTGAIEERWQEFQKKAAVVQWLANGLIVFLFVLAPFLIWQLGLTSCWPVLAAGLLAFTGTIAWKFHGIHKAFYPAAEDPRFTHFLTMLLSPATAIRAGDVLSRPLLEPFHPLAVARVFCSSEAFADLARSTLRELRHPALPECPRAESIARATEAFWRARLQESIEAFLRQNGLDPAALMRPPASADAGCRSYCPRCLAQFDISEGACEDCGGLKLAPFSPQGGELEG